MGVIVKGGVSIFGPNIVTNGLLLWVDAANPTSYSGTGTTWTDLSGNFRNLTLTNGPSYSINSIVFDGSNDYAVSQEFTPNITSKTMMAWCKLSSVSQQAGGLIGLQGSGGEPFDSIVYNETGNGWGFGSTNFSRTAWSGVKETSTSTWSHIAATYADNDYKMYRNGTVILTTTSYLALNYNFASKATIGVRHTTGGNPYLSASISQGMIYNRALSSAEITQNYNALKSRFGL